MSGSRDRSVDGPVERRGRVSQATTDGRLLFTAGQIALDEGGGGPDGGSVDWQTRRCLDRVVALLEAHGLGLRDVLHVRVMLSDIDAYDEMNEAYEAFFSDAAPARTTIEVGGLPSDADVGIEAVASVIEEDEVDPGIGLPSSAWRFVRLAITAHEDRFPKTL